MEGIKPNELNLMPEIYFMDDCDGVAAYVEIGPESVIEEKPKEKMSYKRKIGILDGRQSTSKIARYQVQNVRTSDELKMPDACAPPPKKCDTCDSVRSRYLYMKDKAREMNVYCHKLNQKMKELVKTNVELASLLLTLLEAVDIPGSPKLIGSLLHLGEGETKKAVLDRINLLLERAGLSYFPGAMGEILYNDLFLELRKYKE